jgi:hypothetical protein
MSRSHELSLEEDMKFRITFKTPDTVEHAVKTELDSLDLEDDLEEWELEKEMRKTLDHYVKYGEVIIVEFDTEEKTARVISAR